jgi:transcriptional regulator with XRE-family HTH domain
LLFHAKSDAGRRIWARATEPSAENAVKIAQALGVPAEYLVTGKVPAQNPQTALSREGRMIILELGKLSREQCGAILSLIRAFRT